MADSWQEGRDTLIDLDKDKLIKELQDDLRVERKIVSDLDKRVEELEDAVRKTPQVHSYALAGKREQADRVLRQILAVLSEEE